ncbi:hypothetical protein B0H14DRAFT_3465214 [Mycena olivaceomarginata]|nr:hypothetical protein B0H14DRAFT_3465214 [Mycena olivaceomarginata]
MDRAAATSTGVSVPVPASVRGQASSSAVGYIASWFGFGGGAAPAPPTPPAAPLPAVPQSTGPWEAGVVYSVVPPRALAAIADDNEELWYGILKGKFISVTQTHSLALSAVVGVSNNSM